MKETENNNLSALGRKVTKFGGFDTFPTPAGVTKVTCVSDEITSNCPVTEQPDWYTAEIAYVPDALCVESKTLKLYLQSFRNDGRFCEAFAAKICEDIKKALAPKSITVKLIQKSRGGVSIVAEASL